MTHTAKPKTTRLETVEVPAALAGSSNDGRLYVFQPLRAVRCCLSGAIGLLLLAAIVSLPREVAAGSDSGTVVRDGWAVSYRPTESDGLEIYDVSYRGLLVAASIKIPQLAVEYPPDAPYGTIYDQLGPRGNVPPVGSLRIDDLETGDGFFIEQDYQEPSWPNFCSYRYLQRFEFYTNGRLKPYLLGFGPGCGDFATYNAYWRFDLDLADASDDDFEWWDTVWTAAGTEGEYPHAGALSPKGFKWRVRDGQSSFAFGVKPRTQESPSVWALRYEAGQGENDLPQQPSLRFPDLWADGEAVQDANVVLWYWGKTNKTPETCVPENPCRIGPESLGPITGDSCQLVELNGGFETDADGNDRPDGWTVSGGSCRFYWSSAQQHSGNRSALVGIPTVADDASCDAWIRRPVTIPADVASATLSFWYNPGSDEGATGDDWQTVRLLDDGLAPLSMVFQIHGNARTWLPQTYDLTTFAGRTVYLEFRVHNDGPTGGGRTWMYVDDVSIELCSLAKRRVLTPIFLRNR